MSKFTNKVFGLFGLAQDHKGPVDGNAIVHGYPNDVGDAFFEVERQLCVHEGRAKKILKESGYSVDIKYQPIPDAGELYTRQFHVQNSQGTTLVFQDNAPVRVPQEK